MESTTKRIELNLPEEKEELENLTTSKVIITKKESKKRVITKTWNITEEELHPDAQLMYIRQLVDDMNVDTNPRQVILKHIT